MRSISTLTTQELHAFLAESPGWETRGDEITKLFVCTTFVGAIDFVVAIASSAEALDHHPDIDIRYRKVLVSLTTHDMGGLTHLDTDLAGLIDAASLPFVTAPT